MLRPSLWVSLVPYGIGRTKPNHYLEILRTVWDNRHDLPYAWRILTRGVSGIRGRTLIVNFPGSPKAIGQSWPVVEPTLRHAAETLERD